VTNSVPSGKVNGGTPILQEDGNFSAGIGALEVIHEIANTNGPSQINNPTQLGSTISLTDVPGQVLLNNSWQRDPTDIAGTAGHTLVNQSTNTGTGENRATCKLAAHPGTSTGAELVIFPWLTRWLRS